MKHEKVTVRRVALLGVLTAAAFVLSWLEFLLPLPIGIPGVKLGLCHIAVLFALYRLGWREAAILSAVRVFLSFLLFGNAETMAYSAAGAALSLAVMILLKRCPRLSPTGVSAAGAVAHNLGQLACAALMNRTAAVGWYFPVLLCAGAVTGTLVGITASLALRYVPNEQTKSGGRPV